MRLGKTHGQTTLILGATQIFFIVMAVVLKNISDKYMLLGVVILSIILSMTLDRLILKKLDVKEIPD
jgi:hypothetical protein